ncbi:hypothetical protein KP509_12G093100 [Ceratopteris richardii]|uniref:Uncharacterized protein n=1 Tax=Ceratopteris richardii TaxID=49495 RepID=A0A8T2TLE6_CERRI|nr:hypothetical protein KP509_12G093100 [Ceratopteris richardii]
MCILQLHQVGCSDVYKEGQWLLLKPRCHIHLRASHSRLDCSLNNKRSSWFGISKHSGGSHIPIIHGRKPLLCAASSLISFPSKGFATTAKDLARSSLASILKIVQESELFRQCAIPATVIVFTLWGLGPLLRVIHRASRQGDDTSWKDSQMYYIFRSFVRPVLLWVGVIFVCRAFDPLVLSTETSQAIKQRFLNFVRSLATVLTFAQCSISISHQMQKGSSDGQSSQESRSLGAQFVNNTVYTAVWVAAGCLFMELLGFSTQRWLTAGGLGTVLITLAGREIFTNFLSSIMIHATRPFVLNEWIQTKIDGYEVSGTVEHVGWWSPTIIRGDDREAVHIPNHKFTVSIVRNLSQKSHWRIKTHFGISHLDVSKVPSIVADMRKVLAKHPQVEQRRLHRRVFFDNINPENQAIMVLVSCFVKTPHFEEYLRVKEVILLDLLKVISHHNARLATPIRSVQRVLDDTASAYRDMNRPAEAQGRPYLLVEATAVSNGQRDSEQSGTLKNGASNAKEGGGRTEVSDSSSGNENLESLTDSRVPSKHKPQLEGLDSMGLNSKDITLLGAAFEKPPAHIPESSEDHNQLYDHTAVKPVSESSPYKHNKVSIKTPEQPVESRVADQEKNHIRPTEGSLQQTGKNYQRPVSNGSSHLDSMQSGEGDCAQQEELKEPWKEEAEARLDTKKSESAVPRGSQSKLDIGRGSGAVNSSATKSQLEENLVLGVALDGPKRTLPLDEVAPVAQQKELVALHNSNSSTTKERRDASPTASQNASDSKEQ